MSKLSSQPRIRVCELGPFRLPGVEVDLTQYTEEQALDMEVWVRENHGYVAKPGVFSWRSPAHRDWFTLKWS